ncbi:hypothetical protein [Amycolatopsis anabasis]|uniref:hypothetical protein n=1 Tax=Amycolatopsis anabasis TaxID=1840409 RepID=UPI00131BC3E4|nr:hypothetical protein [Amycolatopsis anabasis]
MHSLTVPAGTYTAGLPLAVRDSLRDLADARVALLAPAIAATVSAFTADPRIVAASTAAAIASELGDFAIAPFLPPRHARRTPG